MTRREFIALVGGAAVAWPAGAWSQPAERQVRIGQVLGTTGEPLARAVEQGLVEKGYAQGKNITLINRFANSNARDMANAIVDIAPNIDVLVVWGTLGAVEAKRAAPTLPTIFLSVGAPVEIGLVKSLARPGGNMTGVTFEAASETYGKRLQVLQELVPSMKEVAVLRTAGDANVAFAMSSIEPAARDLSLDIRSFDVSMGADLEDAFAAMRKTKVDALIVIAGALTYAVGRRIAQLAIEHRLPSCHGFKETVAAGGLVSIGPDLVTMAGQGAAYLDKIIRGAKPTELPVEQPARYELHINLKTAKALGLTVPPSLLARADEVIE